MISGIKKSQRKAGRYCITLTENRIKREGIGIVEKEVNKFLPENRKRIESEYKKRKEKYKKLLWQADVLMASTKDQDICLSLMFLYTHMPISDVTNYDADTFLDFAEHAVILWKRYSEVRKLPEEIFLNYVLFHRVNDEEIAPCRGLFYEVICQECINIAEADFIADAKLVLDINWWCAKHVTYHSTDERTRSALAVYDSGYGRCGEESVFVVNAFRSVGIPARQVYVPRWAHCDDNHAWVEIYLNGIWHFLGACEPECVLNKGWFNSAASRAMLVHTRWFDSEMPSGEDAIGAEGIVILQNELSRYASTRRIRVKVLHQDGTPAEAVKVKFSVINYAEVFPLAEVITDEQGEAEFSTGYGTLYIEAVKGEDQAHTEYAYDLCEPLEMNERVMVLHPLAEVMWQDFDMIAPTDSAEHMVQTEKGQDADRQKLILEANVSRKKLHEKDDHHNWEKYKDAAKLQKSGQKAQLIGKLEKALSEKDLTDIRADVLQDAFYQEAYQKDDTEDIYVNAVVNPRVNFEILRPCKKQICHFFTKEEKQRFTENPKLLLDYINQNVIMENGEECAHIISSPVATLQSGYGSMLSQKVLFVAACRSLGVAARLNPVTNEPEYYRQKEWTPADEAIKYDAKVCFRKGESEEQFEWKYQENWSLAIFTENGFKTLNLQQLIWDKACAEISLQHGVYRILTAQRMPDGNQFCSQCFVVLYPQKQKNIILNCRKYNLSDLLEQITLPELFFEDRNGKRCESKLMWRETEQISIWLEEANEPTEHILNEIMQKENEYEKVAEQIHFIVRDMKVLEDPVISQVLQKIKKIHVMLDKNNMNLESVGRKMYVDFGKLPLILVTDAEGNGLYASSGYNVGTGELLLNILNRSSKN